MKSERLAMIIVDDEESQRTLLAGFYERRGHRVRSAGNGAEALEMFTSDPAPIVIADLKMPGMSGIDLVRELVAKDPTTQVIVLTAFGTIQTAVSAMKAGAVHYQTKPVELEELTVNIDRATERYRDLHEARRSAEALRDTLGSGDIIGDSPATVKLRELVALVAQSDTPVLIHGPIGGGKDLIARAIFRASRRSQGRFVVCGPADGAENSLAALFGAEPAPQEGATGARLGKLELASGGALYLSELTQVSPTAQERLLSYLDSGAIERSGGAALIAVDVRVISASRFSPESAQMRERVSADLLSRLSVVRIAISPLSERREDIPALAQYFLERFSRNSARTGMRFSVDALAALENYSWPGNVRELKNCVERAATISPQAEIGVESLGGAPGLSGGADSSEAMEEIEKRHIYSVLQKYGWNITLSASKLGLHRNTLSQKIKDYGLSE